MTAKFIKRLQISIYNVTYQLLTCYKVPQTWIIRPLYSSPVFPSRGGIVSESQTSYAQLVLLDVWQICDSAEHCHFFEKIITILSLYILSFCLIILNTISPALILPLHSMILFLIAFGHFWVRYGYLLIYHYH